MEIEIKNCNNIVDGKLNVEENKLNIIYGLNGTGKSTIASAVSNMNDLSFLKTFGKEEKPEVIISTKINKVVTFNSEFVNNVVFNNDSVIDNSFDVFIKSDNYDTRREKIINALKSLNQEPLLNNETKNLIDTLTNLSARLKLTKNNQNMYLTNEFKSVLNKENIYNIPNEFKKYDVFLKQKEKNIDWIAWKTKGFEFDKENKCPFCTNALEENYEIEKERFQQTFKKNDVKHLTELKDLIEKLEPYMNKEKFEQIIQCITTPEQDNEIEMVFLKFTTENIYLLKKFDEITNFDSYNFRDTSEISQLGDIVKKLKINKDGLEFYNSDLFIRICDMINKKIESIYSNIDILKKEMGGLNGVIKATIEESKKEINEFLEIAGYDYRFDLIVEKENQARTILRYTKDEIPQDVEKIEKHLSFGEKNAFSLILFMFYALSQNPDLIILDDPISSFDGNKKYAIIDRLFTNQKNVKSLKNKTVIMLTHDFEPLIDFVKNGKPVADANAYYVKNNNGTLIIDNISRKNIKSINELYYKYVCNDTLNIISRVIFLRKYIELINVDNDKGKDSAYQILSCLIHGKKIIMKKINEDEICMNDDEIKLGNKYINKFIKDFDYNQLLTTTYNQASLIENFESEKNNYIKTQIFREYSNIANIRKNLDDVVLKFIDEIYHVENDYIYSIDLIKYDMIPDFIIEKIKKFMKSEEKLVK